MIWGGLVAVWNFNRILDDFWIFPEGGDLFSRAPAGRLNFGDWGKGETRGPQRDPLRSKLDFR